MARMTRLKPSPRIFKPGEGLKKIAMAVRAGAKPVKQVTKPTAKGVSRRIPKKPEGAK
jgi:hypothetical protein